MVQSFGGDHRTQHPGGTQGVLEFLLGMMKLLGILRLEMDLSAWKEVQGLKILRICTFMQEWIPRNFELKGLWQWNQSAMARAAIARFVAYFSRPQLLRPLFLNFFQSMVNCLFCFLSCTLQTSNVFLQLVSFYRNIQFYLTANPRRHSMENFHIVRVKLYESVYTLAASTSGPQHSTRLYSFTFEWKYTQTMELSRSAHTRSVAQTSILLIAM